MLQSSCQFPLGSWCIDHSTHPTVRTPENSFLYPVQTFAGRMSMFGVYFEVEWRYARFSLPQLGLPRFTRDLSSPPIIFFADGFLFYCFLSFARPWRGLFWFFVIWQ